jgi:hypothetical protein
MTQARMLFFFTILFTLKRNSSKEHAFIIDVNF